MNGNAIKLTDKISLVCISSRIFFPVFFRHCLPLHVFQKKVFGDAGALSWYITKSANRGASSKYAVSKENFEKQMDYIKRHFSTVSLDTILETNEGKPECRNGRRCPNL